MGQVTHTGGARLPTHPLAQEPPRHHQGRAARQGDSFSIGTKALRDYRSSNTSCWAKKGSTPFLESSRGHRRFGVSDTATPSGLGHVTSPHPQHSEDDAPDATPQQQGWGSPKKTDLMVRKLCPCLHPTCFGSPPAAGHLPPRPVPELRVTQPCPTLTNCFLPRGRARAEFATSKRMGLGGAQGADGGDLD